MAFFALSLFIIPPCARSLGESFNSFIEIEIKPIFQAVIVTLVIIGFFFVYAFFLVFGVSVFIKYKQGRPLGVNFLNGSRVMCYNPGKLSVPAKFVLSTFINNENKNE